MIFTRSTKNSEKQPQRATAGEGWRLNTKGFPKQKVQVQVTNIAKSGPSNTCHFALKCKDCLLFRYCKISLFFKRLRGAYHASDL